MSIIHKAKELGAEIRKTEQYRELARTGENVQTDPEASRLVEDVHKIQQQIQFSQQSGVQPSEEQINMFNAAKNKMDTSLTIQAYARARGEFEELMKSVNSTIGEGIEPEGGSE